MDTILPTPIQYAGPATTAVSAKEGRLKVDAGGKQQKKKKILKKVIGKYKK